uniref:FIT family protein CG10671-like n=1 Tax=Hirondellea gigas TaxID=1518452 RepID=A0A2P2I0U8_9CRUS
MSRRGISDETISKIKLEESSNSNAGQATTMFWPNSVQTMTSINNKLRYFRHYMLIPLLVRAAVTVFVVCFLSLLEGADEISHVDGLTAKNSILNMVFVKKGWAWTMSATVVLLLSLLPLASEPRHFVLTSLARLVLLSAVFYFWCALVFPSIEHWTGLCLSKNVVMPIQNKRKCVKKGHIFYSFDISGHAFLMVYCVLTLMQEARGMKRYISMGDAIVKLQTPSSDSESDDDTIANDCDETGEFNADATSYSNSTIEDNKDLNDAVDSNEDDVFNSFGSCTDCWSVFFSGEKKGCEPVSVREAAKFKSVYLFVWPLICVSYCCVCFMCVTWDVVLIITSVYYHSVPEKFIGVMLAATSWALLYRGLFIKLKIT